MQPRGRYAEIVSDARTTITSPGRPGAQPQERRPRAATRPPDRLHRALGFGEVVARRSTRSTPRASAATSSRCRRTRASSSARWTSPTSTSSRGCRRRSRSTRSRRRATRGRPSARSPRSTTTCACSTRASASRTARTAGGSSRARRRSRSSTACSSSRRAPASRCSRPSCAAARASTTGCSRSSRAQGFTRARIDGELHELAELIGWATPLGSRVRAAHDRGRRRPAGAPAGIERRLTDSLETALRLAEGVAEVEIVPREGRATATTETLTFSEHLACNHCGLSFDELAPRNFSFNSPYGACERCDGLGTRFEVDPELVVPDDDLQPRRRARSRRGRGSAATTSTVCSKRSPRSTASPPTRRGRSSARRPGTRCSTAPATATSTSGTGTGTDAQRSYTTAFEGVVPWLERRHTEAESDRSREQIEGYMREVPCPACDGARLRPASLAVTIGGMNISRGRRAVDPQGRRVPRRRSSSPSATG